MHVKTSCGAGAGRAGTIASDHCACYNFLHFLSECTKCQQQDSVSLAVTDPTHRGP